MSGNPPKIGLIAGWGRYPVVLAEALVDRGYEVSCVGIRDHASAALESRCHRFQIASLTKMAAHIRFFARHGIDRVAFAGKIHKVRLFDRGFLWQQLPDLYCVRCFFPHFISGRKNRNDDSLLTAAVEGYARRGVEIVPATDLVPELLMQLPAVNEIKLSRSERQDIAFGWQLAKEMGRLDIGQSVAVKGRAVLAVEAVEGTDECIRRAGELCRAGGFTVVKVAKPNQDMRFDVPTIGMGTMKTMQAAGARLLAVERGKTIIVDEPEVFAFAKQHGITIVAHAASESPQYVATAAV